MPGHVLAVDALAFIGAPRSMLSTRGVDRVCNSLGSWFGGLNTRESVQSFGIYTTSARMLTTALSNAAATSHNACRCPAELQWHPAAIVGRLTGSSGQ